MGGLLEAASGISHYCRSLLAEYPLAFGLTTSAIILVLLFALFRPRRISPTRPPVAGFPDDLLVNSNLESVVSNERFSRARALIKQGIDTLDIDMTLTGISMVRAHVPSDLKRLDIDSAIITANAYYNAGLAFESLDMLNSALEYFSLASRHVYDQPGARSVEASMLKGCEKAETAIKALKEKLENKS